MKASRCAPLQPSTRQMQKPAWLAEYTHHLKHLHRKETPHETKWRLSLPAHSWNHIKTLHRFACPDSQYRSIQSSIRRMTPQAHTKTSHRRHQQAIRSDRTPSTTSKSINERSWHPAGSRSCPRLAHSYYFWHMD